MAQEDQKVQDLPDITSSSNDQHIMVITDTHNNQLRKEKIEDFIKDFVSTDENNGLKAASDGKLYTVDTTNADNITSGVLDKNRLPDSGVEAKKYTFPEAIEVDAKGCIKSITNGTPGGNNADKDLSNISDAAKEVIRKNSSSGFSLFDLVEKDHILTYEESKGFALLGSWAYKEPVAGSRYGYPDFYARCIEEKEAATPTEITLGVSVITVYVHSNGHTFYDIADKEAVDAFYDTFGACWMYGVDVQNERVFLPRNDWFTQNGTAEEIGKFVEAGLPNIEGWFSSGYVGAAFTSGPFSQNYGEQGKDSFGAGNYGFGKIHFNASAANPIYGNSDTVQPPAVKKLVYMVVGNTEQTSAVTDIVDITTTKNDTTPLFTAKYFDFKPNHLSWLKAGNQQNSAGIYTSAYNELVKCLSNNPQGLKVVDTTQMTEGEDYTDFWKVDQINQTFTTPIRTGEGLKENANLYFKVANAVQNLELLDVGAITEALADKLDRGNKAEIVSWAMPDYSAGISVNANTPVTAEYHGYLVTEYWYNNATFTIYVDGIKVSGGGCSGSIFQVNAIATIVPIKKGSTFKVVLNGPGVYTTSVFYPLLGGNNA